MHGIEVLASGTAGWPKVGQMLNNAHYRALKSVLGIEGASLGTGGYTRLRIALGLDLRLASKVALRIFSARARLLSLPCTTMVSDTLAGAGRVSGSIWLDDSLTLERVFDIPVDFPWLIQQLDSSLPPKSQVRSWIHNILFSKIVQHDATWLREHESHCFSWLSDAQLEKKMLTILATAHWSKRDWLYVRAWYLARLSGQPPFAIFSTHAELVFHLRIRLFDLGISLSGILACS